jgi:hypothetical protein
MDVTYVEDLVTWGELGYALAWIVGTWLVINWLFLN